MKLRSILKKRFVEEYISVDTVGNDSIYAYGAVNKNEDILLNSSSGGVVYELCHVILGEGGAVCASIYDYDLHELKHTLIEDVLEIEKTRGSKYFQSDISGVYKDIERFLKCNMGRKLLFIGTPCQCAAIKNYLKVKRIAIDNLFCVDIICHGVGSNQIWNDFVKDIERKNNDKIVKITFKDKRRGWLLPYAVAYGSSGKEYDLCDYMTLYNKHLIMRDECHACSFASIKRVGDITVGDFWNVQKVCKSFYNTNGVSCVLCNTEKGNSLFLSIREKIDTVSLSVMDCIQPNMQHPTPDNELSDVFWNEYQSRGFTYVRKKYASKIWIDRVIRHFLVKFGVWKV